MNQPKNPRRIDMTGATAGLWSVLHQAGNTKGGGALWLCRCQCGTERAVLGSDLRNGKSVSCGCAGSRATIGERRKKHGLSGKRLYNTWKGMRARCSHPRWVNYHGKGITVCAEWESFEAFRDWAMTNGYSDTLTIERKDNSLGYTPENCIWADKTVQARNRSIVLRAPDGRSWAEVAEAHGISSAIFNNRIRSGGWEPEVAATWPLGKRRSTRQRTALGQWAPGPRNWKR